MYTNNAEQLFSFFVFIVVGTIIGIIFDIFRIFRRTIKTSDIVTYIEDISFWIISMFIIITSIFMFNNGELRLYIFIGIIIGATLYLLFISKYCIKLGIFVFKTLKKAAIILFTPFKFIFNIFKKILLKPIYFIFINFKKIFKKIIIFDKKTW